MNDTELIINDLITTLKEESLLKGGVRSLAKYFGISHTAIYNMIKNDRITIKFFKAIKTDEKLSLVVITDKYIVNNILMGF